MKDKRCKVAPFKKIKNTYCQQDLMKLKYLAYFQQLDIFL